MDGNLVQVEYEVSRRVERPLLGRVPRRASPSDTLVAENGRPPVPLEGLAVEAGARDAPRRVGDHEKWTNGLSTCRSRSRRRSARVVVRTSRADMSITVVGGRASLPARLRTRALAHESWTKEITTVTL
jgi:hypothetical protein